MATITQTISPYSVVPQRSNPSTFSSDMDTFLTEQVTRFSQLNTFGTQANALRDEVNGFQSTTFGYVSQAAAQATIATTKAGEASGSALAAHNDRVFIEALVIPTEAINTRRIQAFNFINI